MTINKMKILALFVSLVALLLAVNAFAEDGDGGMLFFVDESVFERDSLAASVSYEGISQETANELIDYLYIHVKNAELEIDVSQFMIPWSCFGDTRTAWNQMTHTHRDVEYYAGAFTPGGSSDSTGKYVGKLKVSTYKAWNDFDSASHAITPSEILATNAAIDKKVDEIVSLIPDETSDLEKILIVHDWLCVNGEYDTERLANNTIPRTSYDIRGILLYEIGVCQAYTWTFDYIMDRFDIPCINVTSSAMGHTWNQVQLDGYWYNMDITWDDPTDDMLGRARHAYFLCSDGYFKTGNTSLSMSAHHSYFDGEDCFSTKYDSAFWGDVNTPMPYIDGEIFYLKQNDGAIKATDIDNPSSTSRVVRSVAHNWRYTRYYLNLIGFEGKLYFNEGEAIACVNTDGSGYRVLKSFPTSDTSCVYGIRLKDKSIEYAYVSQLNVLIPANGSIEIITPITSVKLTFSEGKLLFGNWVTMEAAVNSGADDSRLVWTSSDPTVATVVKGGRVDALKYGTTVITATSPDDPSVKSAVSLTVYANVASISLADNATTMYKGAKVTLKLKLNEGALPSDVTWVSSNPEVLSVDRDGAVTVLNTGTVTVSASSKKDPTVTDSITITVEDGMPGDVNGDSKVNTGDAVALAQYLAGWSIRFDALVADVNRDGKVNTGDAVLLAQFLAGWSVTLR